VMGRLTAGTSGVALLAAWGVCVARYATAGAGDYERSGQLVRLGVR
jgi:hypothetical protein